MGALKEDFCYPGTQTRTPPRLDVTEMPESRYEPHLTRSDLNAPTRKPWYIGEQTTAVGFIYKVKYPLSTPPTISRREHPTAALRGSNPLSPEGPSTKKYLLSVATSS